MNQIKDTVKPRLTLPQSTLFRYNAFYSKLEISSKFTLIGVYTAFQNELV